MPGGNCGSVRLRASTVVEAEMLTTASGDLLGEIGEAIPARARACAGSGTRGRQEGDDAPGSERRPTRRTAGLRVGKSARRIHRAGPSMILSWRNLANQ